MEEFWTPAAVSPAGKIKKAVLTIQSSVAASCGDGWSRCPDSVWRVADWETGGGSDIAIFQVQDVYLNMSESSRIYPACLPPTDRQQPEKGVHSGWSDRQTCLSTGDSGSPLMALEVKRPWRLYVEGILSFVKGCETVTMGAIKDNRRELQHTQFSENMATYTKLSCFLPWVAQQYELSYDRDPATDMTCSKGTGGKPTGHEVCKETYSSLFTPTPQLECIFPFYYLGKFYEECFLFVQENFVFPVFRV